MSEDNPTQAGAALSRERIDEIRTFVVPDEEVPRNWIDCSESQAADAINDLLAELDRRDALPTNPEGEVKMTKPEVSERKDTPGSWGVEQFTDDGACMLAVFSGPEAESRSRAYAATRTAADNG